MKPEIFGYVPIGNDKEKIGYLQLVIYDKLKIPQLEFSLDKKHWGKGIMSRELPKYLKFCEKFGHTKLIANVEKSNLASIKLLENNGFIKLKDFEEVYSYVIDLKMTKKQLLAGLEAMEKSGYLKKMEIKK